MRVLVFEDTFTAQLSPITTSRPAYAITCASYRLIDFLRKLSAPIHGSVRGYLQPIQAADFTDIGSLSDLLATSDSVLAVNARMVPSITNFETLRTLIAHDAPGIIESQGALVAAVLSSEQLAKLSVSEIEAVDQSIEFAIKVACGDNTLSAAELGFGEKPLFRWPHEVVHSHMQLMNESLALRLKEGDYKQLQDGVFVAEGATLGDYSVIDCSEGPIVLDADVQVGPFCYLSGPVYAGPKTRVIEHAALKDAVSLGHTTKVGGEVEASVIEPYTNKQHHGFLGHSYLGSWINLGAGTCNSDLKNTYGKINIEYNGHRVPSEMQFLGCIVGDYAKTAINTGIFTGKVIGVSSMLYGFVTQNVPSFMNYAQIFGQVAEIPADVMIATQARMFARRNVQQRECDISLIRSMYEATASEREQVNQISTL